MNVFRFHKMQGTGNDFVVLDNRKLNLSIDKIIEHTPKLCDRKYGIGADGLLVLESPQIDGVDFTMIYRNADGSDAGMCGNGARCLTMYAAHHGFNQSMNFNVHNSIYCAYVEKKERNSTIHFPNVKSPNWIEIDNEQLVQVYPNTEHVVCISEKSIMENEEWLIKKGSKIRHSEKLNPPGTNVNFVCIENDQNILLQTYERGVENLTLACGTGAIAAAISTHFISHLKNDEYSINIRVKGGNLRVSFGYNSESETYEMVTLKGSAEFVYEGTISI